MGASMVKWTTLDPCSGFSESDPKDLENICIYKAKQFLFTKNQFQTTYISILEDGASGEQVGDIIKIIVKNLLKI